MDVMLGVCMHGITCLQRGQWTIFKKNMKSWGADWQDDSTSNNTCQERKNALSWTLVKVKGQSFSSYMFP